MNIPKYWQKFGMQIHQDFLLDHPDFFSGINNIFENLCPEEKTDLITYLEYLVSANLSGLDLSKIWIKSNSEIFFHPKNMQKILENILKEIK